MKSFIESMLAVVATLVFIAYAFAAFTEPVSYPEAVVKDLAGYTIVDIHGHLFEITDPLK